MKKNSRKFKDKEELTNKDKSVRKMSKKILDPKQLKNASGGADDNYYLYFSDPSEE